MSNFHFFSTNFYSPNNLLSLACFITKFQASLTIVNRNDEIGSPFLSPFLILNGSIGDPFTKTDKNADLTHQINQFLILSPKPI